MSKMEAELEINDFKRGNYHQQKLNTSNQPVQTKLGYQLKKQSVNLSSMDSAATESELSEKNSLYSNSSSENKSSKTSRRNYSQKRKNNNNKKKLKRRNSTSSGRSKSNSSRSTSYSIKKWRRTPSPWPRKNQQLNSKPIKPKGQGLTAIQNKICKYWKQGKCNQPQKCQFTHYQFGKIIQEHKKEFSNFLNTNQKIRDGLIMVKLTVFKLIGEEELKNLIRDKTEFIAKEIEISYQNAKQYKKMKKSINQINKNKLEGQIEKNAQIQNIVYDSIYHLQINNNEINAAQRAEAQIKRKIQKEEKRVQKQIERQNQLLIQDNIIKLINQNINTSQKNNNNNLLEEEIDDATDNNINKLHNTNKYTSLIQQDNQDKDCEVEDHPPNHVPLLNNFIEEQDNNEEIEKINEYESILDPQRQQERSGLDENHYSNDPIPQTLEKKFNQQPAATYIQNSQSKLNEYRLAQINTLPKKGQQNEQSQQLTEFVKANFPTNNTKINKKNQFQIFKELRKQVKQKNEFDLIYDENLMDSVQSTDSETIKEMTLKYGQQQLYDWRFICQQKLYINSETQNVFNLKDIQKEKYDPKQLISFNIRASKVDTLNIYEESKNTIKNQIQADQNNKNIHNLIFILKQNIAEQIFEKYTLEEIHEQMREIDELQKEENKKPGINDMYIFLKIFAQISARIINLNFSQPNEEIRINNARQIYTILEYLKTKSKKVFMFELSNDTDNYKIYNITSNSDPIPPKTIKQIFQ